MVAVVSHGVIGLIAFVVNRRHLLSNEMNETKKCASFVSLFAMDREKMPTTSKMSPRSRPLSDSGRLRGVAVFGGYSASVEIVLHSRDF